MDKLLFEVILDMNGKPYKVLFNKQDISDAVLANGFSVTVGETENILNMYVPCIVRSEV